MKMKNKKSLINDGYNMKYLSIYSPGKECSANQYICELLCQKKAEFDKVKLPLRFWEIMPEWARYFKKNLRQVAKLLKVYDPKAIINTVKGKEFGRRYSIYTEFAENLIKKEQEKINLVNLAEKNIIERVDVNQKPRQQNVKPGILSKLADLDN